MAKNEMEIIFFGAVRVGLQLAKVTGPELYDTHSGTLLQRLSRKIKEIRPEWRLGTHRIHGTGMFIWCYMPTLGQFSVNIPYMDQISKGKCISPMDPMLFGLLVIAYWSLSFLFIGNRFRWRFDWKCVMPSGCLFQSPNGDWLQWTFRLD